MFRRGKTDSYTSAEKNTAVNRIQAYELMQNCHRYIQTDCLHIPDLVKNDI